MKFDVIVGNPPYDERDVSESASSGPLYNHFFNFSKNIAKEKVDMIFPARWMTGAGKGLSKFTEAMVNDTHIKNYTLYANAKDVFPNTQIKGGVCYCLRDASYNGKTNIKVVDVDGRVYQYKGYLNSDGLGIFIPFKELLDIYRKVRKLDEETFDNIVHPRNLFRLPTNFLKKEKNVHANKVHDDDIAVLGLKSVKGKRSQRVKMYVDKNYPISKGMEYINKWKMFASKSNGDGVFGEKLSHPETGEYGEVATDTFIMIGTFDTKEEVENVKKYFCTKFFRTLLNIRKNTQDCSAKVYKSIPIQDFTNKSDINWDCSLNEIDDQLYKKYGFNDDEINFIERKVNSMSL